MKTELFFIMTTDEFDVIMNSNYPELKGEFNVCVAHELHNGSNIILNVTNQSKITCPIDIKTMYDIRKGDTMFCGEMMLRYLALQGKVEFGKYLIMADW